jgi:hypothetical protein
MAPQPPRQGACGSAARMSRCVCGLTSGALTVRRWPRRSAAGAARACVCGGLGRRRVAPIIRVMGRVISDVVSNNGLGRGSAGRRRRRGRGGAVQYGIWGLQNGDRGGGGLWVLQRLRGRLGAAQQAPDAGRDVKTHSVHPRVGRRSIKRVSARAVDTSGQRGLRRRGRAAGRLGRRARVCGRGLVSRYVLDRVG